jgi:hypothetical protein
LLWLFFIKLDQVAKLCRADGYIRSEKLLDWATEHKTVTFMTTETVNIAKSHFGMDPMGVMFALGGSVVNMVVIFLVLPARKAWRKVRGTWTL